VSWFDTCLQRMKFTGKVIFIGHDGNKNPVNMEANVHNGMPGSMKKLESTKVEDVK
jgi:hypothetical protein